MSRRRGTSSIAANPVLIGAATTLVIIVAVFLAYNANSGLPFVPTYQLTATVPDANNLVKGNDVRIGGARVGILSDITPVQHEDGTVGALLKMKLQTSEKPLPVDSAILIRSRSALGLKYIEITRGQSAEGFQDGATIPLANAHPEPVEIDQVFNMFDKPTRDASQTNLEEFGNALAGRGQNLNQAIAAFNPLLLNLVPVMTQPVGPQDAAEPLLRRARQRGAHRGAGGRAAGRALPQPRHDVHRDLRRARPAAGEHLGGPAALEAAIKSFPIQRPFLRNSAAFFRELRPGVHSLKTSAPILADAFETGVKTLPKAVPFNNQLKDFFPALERLATDPLVPLAIKDLTRTVNILDPTLKTITPAQTVCNYGTLFFRNVASLLSEGDKNGTWQRFMIVAPPQGPNNEGGPSSAPANGPNPDNYLHSNPYPNAAGAGQTNECEAGNEGYIKGRQVIGNVPGNQGLTTEGQTAKNAKAAGRLMRFFRGSHVDAQGRRILRKDRRGMDPFRAGVLALVIFGIFIYLGFTKDIPFVNNPFEFKAVFVQSNSLRINSPVRIAGVNVGKVRKIERFGNTDNAVVTMSVDKTGLPIHKDAELKIRPRIFLEGNYFVDLKPGTPSAPKIDDGDTIPMTQTATPVQLDQILTTLQSDQRQDLKDLLEGYGKALTYKPTAADDVGQDPAVKGETAAQSLNDSLEVRAATRSRTPRSSTRRCSGTEPDDLSKLIQGVSRTAEGLDRNEAQLKDLITNFNTTMAAFASQSEQPERLDPPARPDHRERQQRVRQPERRVPADARLRARHPAGRQGDAGHHQGRAAVDRPGHASSSSPRSWAACCRTSRRPPATWPSSRTRASRCCPRPTSRPSASAT